jgi:hypothetical protein
VTAKANRIAGRPGTLRQWNPEFSLSGVKSTQLRGKIRKTPRGA